MTQPPRPPRHPLARRLLLRLAAIGLLLAVLTAGIQQYLEYQRGLAALHARLDEVGVSYRPSVEENAWLDDRERLGMLAHGIANLEGVAQVQVSSDKNEVVATAGTPAAEPLERSYALTRDYDGRVVQLGRLTVVADLAVLRRETLDHMGWTLLSTMVVLAVLGALLYAQVHTLVAHRLAGIAAYARRLGRDGPAAAPPRSSPVPETVEDELTDLGAALSRMHHDLSAAHEALAAGEARYREMFTSSPVTLFEEDFTAVKAELDRVDLAPGQTLAAWLNHHPDFVRHCAALVRVLDVNDAAATLHRAQSRDELMARLPAVFVPSSYDTFRQQLECIHAGLWDLTAEAQVRTLDGEILEIVLHWHVPPSHRHTLSRVIVACEDITALKAARRAQDMTLERLMEANAELERFTFVASHDLQEPVRSVVSFTQLLQRRLAGLPALTPEAAEFLDYLLAAAQRMQAQVAGLQDYAVSGRTSAMAPVALDDVVADARGEVEAALTAVGGQVQVAALPRVMGDRGQLVQLFRHLLDNAVKFHAIGRPLRVSVTARADGAFWRVEVRDNGRGIEPSYAATVFELFRRLHGPGEIPGAGIGLTICRRIVERHGGVIAIDTTVSDGTAVVFTLPAAELVNPAPAA